MTSTLGQVAATLAGLAICATAFIAMPQSLLKGVGVAVAFCIVAALLITAVRAFG